MPSGANSSRIRSRIAAACGAPSNDGPVHVQQLLGRGEVLLPLRVGDERRSARGRSGPGVAQVQCTPCPPTQVAPAAAGMPGEPSAARPIRCVPCRAVIVPSTTTPPGMPETPLSCDRPWEASRAAACSSGSGTFLTFMPSGRVTTGPASTISTLDVRRACSSSCRA